MNKHIIISLLLCLPMLFSCSDEIPYGERYEELESVEVKRNILLEDFTGQFCSNCPEAHKVITDLQALYGEHVIAVAIHAGHFGIAEGSNANFVGLMQPEGNTYAAHWGVEAYPMGIINRTSGLLKHTEWAAYSRQALMSETSATISLTAEAIEGDIVIHTEVQSEIELSSKLQLWITESNIATVQQNGGTLDLQYLHHHVYRAAVNGLWGEDITLAAGIPTTCDYRIALRSNWNIANLSVVAFLYTEADGVLEVTEQYVNTNI